MYANNQLVESLPAVQTIRFIDIFGIEPEPEIVVGLSVVQNGNRNVIAMENGERTLTIPLDTIGLLEGIGTSDKMEVQLIGDFTPFYSSDGKLKNGAQVRITSPQNSWFLQEFTVADDFSSIQFTRSLSRLLHFELTYPEQDIAPAVFKLNGWITEQVTNQKWVSAQIVKSHPVAELKFTALRGHIPLMVYGNQFAQSISVSNRSDNAAKVDVLIYGNQVSAPVIVPDIGLADANSSTELGGKIKKFVEQAGLTGRVSLDLLVHAPAETIEINALFYDRRSGDRTVIPVEMFD